MVIQVPLSAEAEAKLRAKAEAAGEDLAAYAAGVLERLAGQPSIEEILAPVRAEFEASGMTEEGLTDYLETAKHELRRERRQDRRP